MKRIIPVLTVLALTLSLAGCMNTANEAAQPEPSPSADYMPQGTSTDGAANGAANGAINSAENGTIGNTGLSGAAAAPFDWTNNAAQIEGQVGQISEISECRVVVSGNTALAAVRFNNAYQGELTERIREMVAAEIMAADPNIQTVAVTSDEEDVTKVYELSDRIRAGENLANLENDINEIVRNATTLR